MKVTKFAIDCGHNCYPDTGAVGNGVIEDNITKIVGELVIRKLNNLEFKAVSVNPRRATSVKSSLRQRVDIANEAGVGLYVSIHCNSATAPSAKGTECYYYGNNEDGKKLSAIISQELASLLKTNNRGAKSGDFFVLRETNATAILIELGFLSNKVEALLIQDSCEKIANKITEVLCEWSSGKEYVIEEGDVKPEVLKFMALEHVTGEEGFPYSNREEEV